jgi:hypothetical protein
MLHDKLKKLAADKARLAKLEASLMAEAQRKLAGLPAEYGFENVNDFIKAVKQAVGGRRGPAAKTRGGRQRRSRAVITEATRAKVKAMVAAGKTGGEIASAVGISLPSVHNIKQALGLVKARG